MTEECSWHSQENVDNWIQLGVTKCPYCGKSLRIKRPQLHFTFTERQNLVYALESAIAILLTGWTKAREPVHIDILLRLRRELGGDIEFNTRAYAMQEYLRKKGIDDSS